MVPRHFEDFALYRNASLQNEGRLSRTESVGEASLIADCCMMNSFLLVKSQQRLASKISSSLLSDPALNDSGILFHHR